MFTLDSRNSREDLTAKKQEVTLAYIPTWAPNIPIVAAVASFLWKSSILQVFSVKVRQSVRLRWRDNPARDENVAATRLREHV